MLYDLEIYEKEGVINQAVQKDLYDVKRQKIQVDDKIQFIKNRIKVLEEEEQKQMQQIINQRKNIKKKHQLINFKESLQTIRNENHSQIQQLQSEQHLKAQSFRNQHKMIINSISQQIQYKKQQDAHNLLMQKKLNEQEIQNLRKQKQLQNENLVLKVKEELNIQQTNIQKFWKQKLTTYKESKLKNKEDFSLETKTKGEILNLLLNQENQYQSQIQENQLKKQQLKEILNDNQVIKQLTVSKIDRLNHINNSLPHIQYSKDVSLLLSNHN